MLFGNYYNNIIKIENNYGSRFDEDNVIIISCNIVVLNPIINELEKKNKLEDLLYAPLRADAAVYPLKKNYCCDTFGALLKNL